MKQRFEERVGGDVAIGDSRGNVFLCRGTMGTRMRNATAYGFSALTSRLRRTSARLLSPSDWSLVVLLVATACASGLPNEPNDVPAERNPPDVVADGGEASDEDGGEPEEVDDLGDPPSMPVDCEDESAADSPWCDEVCAPFDVDVGWDENVRWFGQSYLGPYVNQCGGFPNESLGWKAAVLWRAPRSGKWVIDNFGSEGSQFYFVVDARCGGKALNCQGRVRHSIVLELEGGTPIVAQSLPDEGERRGAGIHRINISPWVPKETGADCLDGADNDGDGYADCMDLDCAQSVECTTPLCADEILSGTVPLQVEGELNFEDHPNRYGGCVDTARERVFAWQAPYTGRFVADMTKSNFRGRMSVRRGGCAGREIGHCPRFGEPSGEKWSTSTAFEASKDEWIYVLVSATDDALAFGGREQYTHYVLQLREWQAETGNLCWDGIDNDGNGIFDQSEPACGR